MRAHHILLRARAFKTPAIIYLVQETPLNSVVVSLSISIVQSLAFVDKQSTAIFKGDIGCGTRFDMYISYQSIIAKITIFY